MDFTYFDIDGVCLMTPKAFRDERGVFRETYRKDAFNKALQMDVLFVQENHAITNKAGSIRGLHYQAPPYAQGKLAVCLVGAVMDVIVDVRRNSKTYGQHLSIELRADKGQALWIPPGFLHGYMTLEDNSEFLYKITSYYNKSAEGAVYWNDPDLSIDWGIDPKNAIVSEKDSVAMRFKDFVTPF